MSNAKQARNTVRRMNADEFLEVIQGLDLSVKAGAMTDLTAVLLSNILLGVRNGFGE